MSLLLNVVYALLAQRSSQPGAEPDREGFEAWLTSDPAADQALSRLLG